MSNGRTRRRICRYPARVRSDPSRLQNGQSGSALPATPTGRNRRQIGGYARGRHGLVDPRCVISVRRGCAGAPTPRASATERLALKAGTRAEVMARSGELAGFAQLKERFPSWEQVADAPTEDVADAIRRGGRTLQCPKRFQGAAEAYYMG